MRHPHCARLWAQDTEGFLGPSTPDAAAAANPYNCAGSGCDFAAEAASPALDLACAHLYPDHWLPQAGEEARRCMAQGAGPGASCCGLPAALLPAEACFRT